MRYVVLLRGINVGGKTVKMETLKMILEEMGFSHVKTLLNSGNVILETKQTSLEHLRQSIEEKLEQTFGFTIHVIIRTMDDIQKLVKADPFKGIVVDKDTRLYVTFVSDSTSSTLQIPYESDEKDVQILKMLDQVVCSVITLSTQKNTTDLMRIIEKEFGKNVTTRNWNTVLKIEKAMLLA